MECYEGATMIKTFRGTMADQTQDTIVLHTNDGSVGYRIVKLQMIPKEAGGADIEGTLKVYKVSQTTIDRTIDFSDDTLLGGGFSSYRDNSFFNEVYIFDNEIFNQDIYITYFDSSTGQPMNYYLELEQVKLDLSENTVATLKNIRNLEAGIP